MTTRQVSVLIPAHLSHTGETRRDTKLIETEHGIADIVERLNHPVFGDRPITTASCCGHGTTIPTITLSDGRVLAIAANEDEAQAWAKASGFETGEPAWEHGTYAPGSVSRTHG